MVRCRSVILILVLICGLAAAVAHAAGGVYLEDIKVKSDGRLLLFDNFNDGDISDWKVSDVSLFRHTDRPNQQQFGLFANKQHAAPATAFHTLEFQPGSVEFGALVRLTPSNEQHDWQKRSACRLEFMLASASSSKVIKGYVYLNPLQESSNVGISTDRHTTGTITKAAVQGPNEWVRFWMRMDPKTRKATVGLENRWQASTKYEPADFESIGGVEILTTFGDGKFIKK